MYTNELLISMVFNIKLFTIVKKLWTIIYDAFEKTLGAGSKLSSAQQKSINQLSEDLTNAIVNFLVSQEFRITKLKSELDVESIKTSGKIPATVKTETTYWYSLKETEKWLNSIKETFKTLEKVKGTKLEKNYLVIKYEDLVHNP